jgi:hypothetical protein
MLVLFASTATRKRGIGTYHYPINIVLKSGASMDVLTLLAKAGPDVLILKDGPQEMCTLAGDCHLSLIGSTTAATATGGCINVCISAK